MPPVCARLLKLHNRGGLCPASKAGKHPKHRRATRGLAVFSFKSYAPVQLVNFEVDEDEDENTQLLGLLLSHPAVNGTAAVLLGAALHLPPFGNLHWSSSDAWLGLQLAVPIILLDLPFFDLWPPQPQLPPRLVGHALQSVQGAEVAHSASSTDSAAAAPTMAARQATDGEPLNSGEASLAGPAADPLPGQQPEEVSVPGPGLDLLLRAMSASNAFHPLQQSEHSFLRVLAGLRQRYAHEGAALGLTLPSELGLLVLHHLAEEMLFRAVLLGGLVHLACGAMYALEDGGAQLPSITLGGMGALDIPQMSALAAGAVAVACSAAVAFLREFRVVDLSGSSSEAADLTSAEDKGHADQQQQQQQQQQQEKEEEEEEEEELFGTPWWDDSEATEEEDEEVMDWEKQEAWMRKSLQQEANLVTSIEVLRDGTSTACIAAAYLLSGNLLASCVAALVSDLVWTAYQHWNRPRVLAEQQALHDLVEQYMQSVEHEKQEQLARLGLGSPANKSNREPEK
ncbi:hypothetical protein N2152v2_007262 [Parachlorella kessleri]